MLNLKDAMNTYNDFKDKQQTMGMLNNMGVFGNNTGMSNFADKFSTWGNDNAFLSNLNGGEGAGGGALGWIGIGQNALKGLQQGFDAPYNDDEVIAGGIGNGIQGFFGANQYDNDIAQAIAGAGNGAKMGAGVGGPWGAAIGGVLGLGSSFLDDL